jgi:tyrosine-protein phosphatase SIW14
MKRLFLLMVLALPVLTLMGTHAISGEPAQTAPAIPRFQRVAPGLFRGGQPTPEGFGFLQWRGIKTVVNLREEYDEKELVEKLGMKYVYIPLDAWDPVPDQAVKEFFRVVNDPESQPVFVHCRRGSDRTGIMVGFYRIVFDGWDGRRAYKEARALGMRWWYRGLKKQLYDFAARPAALRSPAAMEVGRR